MKIFSKIIDFVLNILVIRDIDPQIFGLTLYFNLLYGLILFYSKNCLKNSYQRRSVKGDGKD